MRILLIIMLSAFIGSCSYSPNEVVTHNNITCTKNDMKPLNGVVKSKTYYGEYVNGLKVGIHKSWYSNGQLKSEGNWLNGKAEGIHKVWYDNGAIKNEESWKDGKKDGVHRYYESNGALYADVRYKEDKKDYGYRAIKIGKLEVARNKLDPERFKSVTYEEVKTRCTQAIDGWRLPTKEEYFTLFLNSDSLAISSGNFWSSSEPNSEDVWVMNMNYGDLFTDRKKDKHICRYIFVRTK